MNIFEKSMQEDKSIIDSITEILNNEFNITISADELKEVGYNMSLSDFIEIDTAIENKDIDFIKNKFSVDDINEYNMQGRQGITSTATNRTTPPKPQVINKPAQPTNQEIIIKTDDKSTNASSASLSPEEYKSNTEMTKEIEELEKMKKMAGLK